MPERKAVSSMIAYVLITLVATTALIITLTALGPAFDNAKSTSTLSDAFQNINALDTAIRTIASESQGSKRTVPLSVSDGTYGINTTNDWLYFEYTPNENLALGGTKGNVHVEQGLEFADYFNSYASGSVASPAWTNTSGQWAVSDSSYLGQNGLAYHSISTLENWKFSATITNVSGLAAGEVFALPTDLASLALYWTFDEASGTKTYDYSDKSNNGTLNHFTSGALDGWTSGSDCAYGGCVKSNRTQHVTSARTLGFAKNQSMAISFWARSDRPDNNNSADFPVTLLTNGIGLKKYQTTNQKQYYFYIYNMSGMNNGTSVNVNAGEEHTLNHWVIQYDDATKTSQVYVNTRLIRNANTVGFNGVTAMSFETPTATWNGTVDEVMIFNRSLTSDEVTALYETTTKKLNATGVQSVTTRTNVSIVLSSPAGQTRFDDVTVTSGGNGITMIVPYDGIDINGTLRVGKGQHRIEILNMGVNATSNRQVVQVRAA
jgi:hypothetical protein